MISNFRHNPDKSFGNSGFTMLEMMIIVVIIGILATIAIPSFSRVMPRLEVRAQARNTLNYLRLARSRAISEAAQFGVHIDTDAGEYIMFKDIVNPSSFTFDAGDSIVVGPETIDPDVIMTSSSFSNNTIIFLPTGGASESGNFVFNLSDGGSRYTVSVLGSTGRSKLQ